MKIMKYNVVWEGTKKTSTDRVPPNVTANRKKINDWGFDKRMADLTNQEYLEYMRIRNRDYYKRNAEKVYERTKKYKQDKAMEKVIKSQMLIGL